MYTPLADEEGTKEILCMGVALPLQPCIIWRRLLKRRNLQSAEGRNLTLRTGKISEKIKIIMSRAAEKYLYVSNLPMDNIHAILNEVNNGEI